MYIFAPSCLDFLHGLHEIDRKLVIVLHKGYPVHPDLQALADNIDTRSFKMVDALEHPVLEVIVIEVATDEHHHTVLGGLVGHLDFAHGTTQELHQHLLGYYQGGLDPDEHGHDVFGGHLFASLDQGLGSGVCHQPTFHQVLAKDCLVDGRDALAKVVDVLGAAAVLGHSD